MNNEKIIAELDTTQLSDTECVVVSLKEFNEALGKARASGKDDALDLLIESMKSISKDKEDISSDFIVSVLYKLKDESEKIKAARQSALAEIERLKNEVRCKLDAVREYTEKNNELKQQLADLKIEIANKHSALSIAHDNVEKLEDQLADKDKARAEGSDNVAAEVLDILEKEFGETICMDDDDYQAFKQRIIAKFNAGFGRLIVFPKCAIHQDENLVICRLCQKKELDDLKIKIAHLESTLQFERGEMQERVRKLKEHILNAHFMFVGNRKKLVKKIGEIFTDCANELNADFRKLAKKTLSGEKR